MTHFIGKAHPVGSNDRLKIYSKSKILSILTCFQMFFPVIIAAGVLSPSIYFLDKIGVDNGTHIRPKDLETDSCYRKT